MTPDDTPDATDATDATDAGPLKASDPKNEASVEFIPAPEAPAASEPEPEPAPAEALEDEDPNAPPYGAGDKIFIHGNNGKFIAVVKDRFENYTEAEAAYERSFQTITKRGPRYSYDAAHYLCNLANPAKTPVGACELDTELKARAEPED
jgi:hypothetical protein